MRHVTHENAQAFNARLSSLKNGEALGFPLNDDDSVVKLAPARTTPGITGWHLQASNNDAGLEPHASRLAIAEFMPERVVEDWHELPSCPFPNGDRAGWERMIALKGEQQTRFLGHFNRLLDAAGHDWLLGFGYEEPQHQLPPSDFGDEPPIATFYKITPPEQSVNRGIREKIGTGLNPESALSSAMQRLGEGFTDLSQPREQWS